MKETAGKIRNVVANTKSQLLKMDRDKVGIKPAPDKWSTKEIVGHLIDSAANNHQRFVRAVYNVADKFPPYNQNEWVRIQRYNNSGWELLVELWSAYNFHLSDLIERIPEEAYNAPCNIGKEEPVSLEFVVKDYLRHLQHHVDKIVEKPVEK